MTAIRELLQPLLRLSRVLQRLLTPARSFACAVALMTSTLHLILQTAARRRRGSSIRAMETAMSISSGLEWPTPRQCLDWGVEAFHPGPHTWNFAGSISMAAATPETPSFAKAATICALSETR